MGYVMSRRAAFAGIAGTVVLSRIPVARAADKLRVGKAVAENWGNVPLDIGMEFGIFEKHGIEVEELIFDDPSLDMTKFYTTAFLPKA